MAPEELALLAAMPPAVAEWEDLLVRLEIMPRALRGTLEDSRVDEDAEREVLFELLDREIRVGRWLEEVASGTGEPHALQPPPRTDTRWLEERFASVRARNFAMVQRRGVDVWAWAGRLEGARVTVYQLLTGLVRADATALAALRDRNGAASGVPAC